MLTICYSLLTWIQSRHRSEIESWIVTEILEAKSPDTSTSLVFTRENNLIVDLGSNSTSNKKLLTPCGSSVYVTTPTRNFSHSTNHAYSNSHSSSFPTSRSESSTPLKINHHQTTSVSCSNSQDSGLNSLKQISELCYNSSGIKRRRLLWEEPGISKILVLYPRQIVELHDWTAFVGTEIINHEEEKEEEVEDASAVKLKNSNNLFYVLLEAEPGLINRNKNMYRRFSQFGQLIAWKCHGSDTFALILQCNLKELVELMYVLRLGQLIFEGGWRVFRLTTVQPEGSIGTLISKTDIVNTTTVGSGFSEHSKNKRHSLTPGDLRRFATGIYETSRSGTPTAVGTPKTCLSKDTSKHDFTKISEESLNIIKSEVNDKVEFPFGTASSELVNWYSRSPKKKSIATIHYTDRPFASNKRKTSLSSLSQKSSSLASLLFCSKSMSIDEDKTADSGAKKLIHQTSSTTRQSCDSLVSNFVETTKYNTLPLAASNIKAMSLSSSAVTHLPLGVGAANKSKTPARIGKPPNILILCEDPKMRAELGSILKRMLATDRYAIYGIRWDQLAVGGWSDQTALLVVSGKIPEESQKQILLQYLGDGGRLFAWCCESPPFGLERGEDIKSQLIYPGSQTTELRIHSPKGWGGAGDIGGTPANFPRVLETNDSEGYSRPLTATVYAKAKINKETVILQLDGGTLGGKAIFSQVHFQDNMKEESTLALLSSILSQTLGLDCTRIKTPPYTIGYLLGDHLKINSFLSTLPSQKLQQTDLTLEIVPRGVKGPAPTVQLLPIHYFECPSTFSTLDYFNNLETREIGRLVIYTEVITSLLNILNGPNQFKNGFAAIAQQQTSGRGRGKNVWLGPIGSALFVTQIHTMLDVGIGRRLSLLQHIAALSIVMAIPQRKEIDLKVKWPNDIYLDGQKIGGILVESRIEGKLCIINIGIGVNVSNPYPTISLNSKLKSKESQITTESFIAKVFTQLESLLDTVSGSSDKGLHSVLDLYMEHWIHNKEDELTVEVSEGKFTTCRIHGIDEYGFLRVIEVSSGHIFSVQPDGNSFDITNRLIAIKH